MPRKRLTDLFVARVTPPRQGRVEYFDAAFAGLALRVTDRGRKSWSLHFRIGGRLRRLTLGSYPALTPAQARQEANLALEKVRRGVDPCLEKKMRRSEALPGEDTFARLVQDYLERHARRNTAPGTFQESKRSLEKDVLPYWAHRPIQSLTKRDAIELIDSITERGAPIHANRVLARLRALFNWAVEKDRLAISPVAGMKPFTKERPRDRVLSDDELRWFWKGCEQIGWPFGPLFQLLLLTAQRRDEVANMAWAELDLKNRVWTLPSARAKNGRIHQVHLSAAAVQIIKALPHIGDRLLFTTNGDTAVSGFSKAKRQLDVAMVAMARQELRSTIAGNLRLPDAHGVAQDDWIIHDLRRTAATGMARLGFPPHVVDKILNHVSGTIRGVAAVYNRFEYQEERCAALGAWGRHVATLEDRLQRVALSPTGEQFLIGYGSR